MTSIFRGFYTKQYSDIFVSVQKQHTLPAKHFLNKKIPVPLWLFFGLPLAAYAVWEAYWYTQVGLSFVKWHTHFMVLLILWFVLALVSSFITTKKEVQLSIAALMGSWLFAELFLSISPRVKNYSETRSNQYQSLFGYSSNDSLHINYKPNAVHYLKSPEFSYQRITNSHRFSDAEFYRDPSKILIQTYGDSFTEGDGAPADSSYPAILRTLLGDGFTVQNYGICGNDPGFYVTQFCKVGSAFKPDVIVLCYGTGDFVVDVMSRGGLERFVEGGWQTRKGPWWEVFYAMSHVSRLFFHAAGIHYNHFFMTKTEKERQLKALEPKWNEMFVEIARLAEQHNTKVLLFKKPERSEIDLNQYDYDMSFFDSLVVNYPEFHHVDLLPAYRERVQIGNGGTTADYYWLKDRHHSPRGYAVMAQLVEDALEKNKLINLSPHAN